jgi:hypothetical protein
VARSAPTATPPAKKARGQKTVLVRATFQIAGEAECENAAAIRQDDRSVAASATSVAPYSDREGGGEQERLLMPYLPGKSQPTIACMEDAMRGKPGAEAQGPGTLP